MQMLAINPNNNLKIFVSDKCPNAVMVNETLLKYGYDSEIDCQYYPRNIMSSAILNMFKASVYYLYSINNLKCNTTTYVNGSISSRNRLKYVSISNNIIYLDDGFQHYQTHYQNSENYFYKPIESYKERVISFLFPFKLNCSSDKISKVVFTNKNLAEKFFFYHKLNKNNKVLSYFDVNQNIKKNDKCLQVINDIFPDVKKFGLKGSFDIYDKEIILLTQPFYEDGYMSLYENIKIYKNYVLCNLEDVSKMVLKPHPREKIDKYLELEKLGVTVLRLDFPLELLGLYYYDFELGVTVDSTAAFSKPIKRILFI